MWSVAAGFIAQVFVFGVSWAARRYARMMAVSVIFASQVWGLVAQQITHDFSPLGVYAAIDFVAVAVFSVMALYWHRSWLIWVATCYAAMIACHATMAWIPIPETLYIWVLNALGYLALGIIVFPPLSEVFGRHVKPQRIDIVSFVLGGRRGD